MKLFLLILAFLAMIMAMPSALNDVQGCQLVSETTYNDTVSVIRSVCRTTANYLQFDQLTAPATSAVTQLTSTRLVQGNGTLYFGGAPFNAQSGSSLTLPPPSPNNVLGNYRPIAGNLVMTPIEGTMKLVDLRYSCNVVSGGNIEVAAKCNIIVNCTSTNKPPIAATLAFNPSPVPLGQSYGYAQFNDPSLPFKDLTSCSFLVDGQDQLGLAQTLAMALDNVGYTISIFTQQ